MKIIRVAAAIIKNENRILATQRGYGDFKDFWEFPGGKLESGESSLEAIQREIKEELDTEIIVEKLVDTIEYDYPEFHLSMDCFLCSLSSNNFVLKEHKSAKWLSREEMQSVNWLPADRIILPKIAEIL